MMLEHHIVKRIPAVLCSCPQAAREDVDHDVGAADSGNQLQGRGRIPGQQGPDAAALWQSMC